MKNFTETDYLIKEEIYKTFALLGGKSDLLSSIGSWKDTIDDEHVLSCLRLWNEWKINELKDRFGCIDF